MSLSKFLENVRSEDAYANIEVSHDHTDKLISGLKAIPSLTKPVKPIPGRTISHEERVEAQRKKMFALVHRLDPKTYLMLRIYITKLLNRVNYSDTIYAIRLLEALYEVQPLVVSYGLFQDVAFTNTVDQIYLNHVLFTTSFENAKAHFKRVPSVSHLALVVLHEFGHIIYGQSEHEADEFVNDFYRGIVNMEYILTTPFRNPSGQKCKNCK